MIGLYIGMVMLIAGAFIHIVMNRNVEVSASGDFWDMPARVKIAIISIIFGILLVCASIMYMLITDPIELLK